MAQATTMKETPQWANRDDTACPGASPRPGKLFADLVDVRSCVLELPPNTFITWFSRFNTNTYPSLRNARNHCRNPGGYRPEPWCYTSPHGEEEPCGLKRCPPGTYPSHMDSAPGQPGTSNNPSLVDSLQNVWQSLSAQWQLAAISGLGLFAVLMLLFLICCCCCRKKRRKASEPSASTLGSSAVKKNGFPVASYAGSGSVVNR